MAFPWRCVEKLPGDPLLLHDLGIRIMYVWRKAFRSTPTPTRLSQSEEILDDDRLQMPI